MLRGKRVVVAPKNRFSEVKESEQSQMRIVNLENQLLHYAHLLVNCPVLARELVSQCVTFSDEDQGGVPIDRVTELFLAVKREYQSTLGAGNLCNSEPQLELFAENELAGADPKKEAKKEHLSARARVFIGSLQVEERKRFFLGSDSSKRSWATTLEEFFMQLSREYENGYSQINLDEKSEALTRVISYLLCLEEENGLEVERKCREHPDWQAIKVEVGIALELLESAKVSWGEVDELYPTREESVENGNAVRVSRNEDFYEQERRERAEPQNKSKPNQGWKIYLYTGLVASLIAYFGWLERSDRHLAAPLPVVESTPELNGSENGENLEIERVGELVAELAQKKAEDLLSGRLVLQIAELNESLAFPASSFASNLQPDEGKTEKRTDRDFEHDEVLLDELLEVGTNTLAQLFFPQGEALGKVRIEKVAEREIFFRRLDWQNPKRSFALTQRSYELRYGHPKYGEVIFSGVVRGSEDVTEPPRLYVFSLQKAWRLTAGQKRIPLNP